MVLGNPGLQRYVAEDPTLERLRSSHISPLGLPSKVPFDEEFFSSLLGSDAMSHRLLDRFLENGLLDLKGNDEWYEHITATAGVLSVHLRANPDDIIPFAYAALLPDVADDDPAVRRALQLLKAEWKTYASVSMASPTVMLRAIIFDALLSIAAEDNSTQSTLALLFSSALPHLVVGREAPVWQEALDQLLQAVEREAEAAWSVPSRVPVPPFPEFNAPSTTVSLKASQVDKTGLKRAMHAAAGPSDENGQSTEGNEHWPNAGDPWSHQFAPLAADAISKAISRATARQDHLCEHRTSRQRTRLGGYGLPAVLPRSGRVDGPRTRNALPAALVERGARIPFGASQLPERRSQSRARPDGLRLSGRVAVAGAD